MRIRSEVDVDYKLLIGTSKNWQGEIAAAVELWVPNYHICNSRRETRVILPLFAPHPSLLSRKVFIIYVAVRASKSIRTFVYRPIMGLTLCYSAQILSVWAVLPATHSRTMSAFSLQPQNITVLQWRSDTSCVRCVRTPCQQNT